MTDTRRAYSAPPTPRQHAGSTDTSVDVQHEDIEGVNYR